MLSLREGAAPRHVLELLSAAQADLQTVQGSSFSALDALNNYNRWANQWAMTLRASLADTAIQELITSRRYWLLQALDPGTHGALRQLVDLEVSTSLDAFATSIAGLQSLLDWTLLAGRTAIVPDTNFLLQRWKELDTVQWHEIVGLRPDDPFAVLLPLEVIRELDRHKRSQTKQGSVYLRTKAKAVLTWAQHVTTMNELVPISEQEVTPGLHVTRGRLGLLPEPNNHRRLPDPDAEIRDRALATTGYFSTLHLLTYDRAMALMARQTGLTVHELSLPDD